MSFGKVASFCLAGSIPLKFLWPFIAILSSAATAADFSYNIELNAPFEVSSLLKQHLEIYKWRKHERNSAEQLQRLVDGVAVAASDLLATEGYFSPVIKTRVDGTTVYIDVDLGKYVLVGNTQMNLQGDIENNGERLAAVQRRFDARSAEIKGERFTQAAWDDLKKRSLATLLNRDYPAAKMSDSAATIDPEAQTADLALSFDSGPAYVFGEYSIKGMQRYPEKLIRDQVAIQVGSPYRRNELIDLQTTLQNLPHYASVLVDVKLPTDAPFIAPVHIEVQEAPLSKVNTGLGYSTNTGAKGELAYRYLNFLNQGWIFNSRMRLEQKEQAFDLGVTLPQLRSGWEHQGWLSYLRSDVEGLLSETYRSGVSRTQKEGNIERYLALQYLTESRELNDGTRSEPRSLTLDFKWIQRALDSEKNPRNGYLVQAEIGGASDSILSDANFLRLYGNAIQYLRVGQNGVLMGRLELGQTLTRDANLVPTDWLFRSGGTGSVRGYDYQSLGIHSGGSIVPGRVMATTTLEYQHPIVKDWRAAVFADYGGAGDLWSTLKPVLGLGIGARWNSPVGQIGADVAYGVDYSQFRFHFAMGLAF